MEGADLADDAGLARLSAGRRHAMAGSGDRHERARPGGRCRRDRLGDRLGDGLNRLDLMERLGDGRLELDSLISALASVS